MGTFTRSCGIVAAGITLFAAIFPATAPGKNKGRELVFDETVIEGKIKRPQVVLISADQRPSFKPMAIDRIDAKSSIFEKVAPEIIEQDRYKNAIQLNFRKGK